MLRQIPIAIPMLLAAACAAKPPEDATARAQAIDERLCLMGIARDRDELERVLTHPCGIAYVHGIDNSIRLARRRS